MTKTERDFAMYGMPEDAIRTEYMESLTARYSGIDMVIAGILSDCQELLAMNPSAYAEEVRKNLNVAKFILFSTTEEV